MLEGGEALVDAVLTDVESSPLSESEKALLWFVEKVNSRSGEIVQADVEALREVGWNDEQIYYAITVCALFNFYNRWVDAAGVHAMSDAAHREAAKRSAAHGYVRR